MSASEDIQQMNTLLDEISQKCATDESYAASLRDDGVGGLGEAGLAALQLASAVATQGGDGDEVAGFGFDMASMRPRDNGLILNGACIGTCKTRTTKISISIRVGKTS